MQVLEAQRDPNKMNPRGSTQRYIVIKMAKVKDKKRILKAERKKADSYLQGKPHKAVSKFFSRNFVGQKGVE